MKTLDLLWKLESQWDLLNSTKKELVDLQNDPKIEAMEERMNESKNRLQNSKVKGEKLKRKLMELEKKLKINNYNMEEIEEDLYQGNISDIQQLEFLNSEKEALRKVIDVNEIELLEVMMQLEGLDEKAADIEKVIISIEDEARDSREHHRELIKSYNGHIDHIENQIGQLEEKVDENLVEKYYEIRKNRGRAVVRLKKSICMGCNMINSTLLVERVHMGNDIVYCESCGRILYSED